MSNEELSVYLVIREIELDLNLHLSELIWYIRNKIYYKEVK